VLLHPYVDPATRLHRIVADVDAFQAVYVTIGGLAEVASDGVIPTGGQVGVSGGGATGWALAGTLCGGPGAAACACGTGLGAVWPDDVRSP